MTPKEQTRLQVLNSLLVEHVTLDQADTLVGASARHIGRMLAAYREKGTQPWPAATGPQGAQCDLRGRGMRCCPYGSHQVLRN